MNRIGRRTLICMAAILLFAVVSSMLGLRP